MQWDEVANGWERIESFSAFTVRESSRCDHATTTDRSLRSLALHAVRLSLSLPATRFDPTRSTRPCPARPRAPRHRRVAAHTAVRVRADWMLNRGPTRLQLRGEGADQLEHEYQQAKEDRRTAAEEAPRAKAAATRTQQQPLQQQPQQSQSARIPQAASFLPASDASFAQQQQQTPQRSAALDESASSFFSVDQ